LHHEGVTAWGQNPMQGYIWPVWAWVVEKVVSPITSTLVSTLVCEVYSYHTSCRAIQSANRKGASWVYFTPLALIMKRKVQWTMIVLTVLSP
jgi:hypothetical protein